MGQAKVCVTALIFAMAIVGSLARDTLLRSLNEGSLDFSDLFPGDVETVKLSGGESLTVCGGTEWFAQPHCMEYEFSSDYMLETFVMNKEVYEAVSDRGGDFEKGDMVEGSRCLAEGCDKKVSLDTGNWCLVMVNMDEDDRASNVTFSYHACLSEGDKDQLILVLAATVGVLAALLCFCMCCCMCLCIKGRKSRKSSGPAHDNSVTATVSYPMDVFQPPYMPPNPNEIYMPYAPPPPPPPPGAQYQPL